MRWPLSPTKVYDPSLGDEVLREAAVRLADGDWAAAEALRGTRDDPWVVNSVLHEDDTVPIARFQEWAAISGSSYSLAHLGHAQLAAAWAMVEQPESNAASETIEGPFATTLRQADATFQDAAALDPAAAEPWVGLMATGRALQLPIKQIEERFVQVHARASFRFDACLHMLRAMSARQGGTHEKMFRLARWLRHEAPAESPVHGLLHLAHVEYVLSETESGLGLDDYLNRVEVAKELKGAALDYLRASPTEVTVGHLETLNLLLLTVVPRDALSARAVRESIRRIDNRATELPWSFWGDDIERQFRTVRDLRARAAKAA
ncbi:MAG: hypothetical protein AAGA37_20095 [Actinomycetota bacterium]